MSLYDSAPEGGTGEMVVPDYAAPAAAAVATSMGGGGGVQPNGEKGCEIAALRDRSTAARHRQRGPELQ